MSKSSLPEPPVRLESDLQSLQVEPAVERLCMDDMLQKYCGEFGFWQIRQFVLTSMAWALEAFHTMVVIFADHEPPWHCTNAACPVGVKSVCELKPHSWEWTGGSGMLTVSEFGLVCSEKYKVGLVQALFFAGCMIGAGVFGHLSDSRLGRKNSLLIVCIFSATFGCLTALSPNYLIYAVLRLLTGFATGGLGLCAFVLAIEPIGPTKRGVVGLSTFYFYSGGIATLSGVAYIFRSWRSLYIATSLPSVIFLVLIFPFISESPRWCLIRGKIGAAMHIIRAIAKSNGKNLPDDVILALENEINGHNNYSDNKSVTGTLLDVIKSPQTRVRLLLAMVISFCVSIVYYGLSLNVVNLGTNLYLNVFINAVAEMPAFFFTAILIDRLGRRPLGIGTQWFSGALCVWGGLMKAYGVWKTIRMVCGVLGIFGMAGTYNLLFIYATELFPTVVRNAAVGCQTQAAQMGAIGAPVVVALGGRVSFLVFGVCAIIGGVLTFFLPETLNRPLYDTMEGLEEGEKE